MVVVVSSMEWRTMKEQTRAAQNFKASLDEAFRLSPSWTARSQGKWRPGIFLSVKEEEDIDGGNIVK
ncbi:hypothetical protein V6N12_001511 [Hibiscus sabdariffa]|uniref:Uncharacterized protein n=1 Tax=Hibiscus sabdariffa TaxID=183260 RepID=A0ABR2BQS9_9ROSI